MSLKLERKSVPLSRIRKRTDNPNKMSAREFDLLVDNVKRMGLTDPLLLRPVEGDPDIDYELVGGHHRYDACAFLGHTEAAATIILDPAFDDEEADFQLIRMNMIKGKLDPEKFVNLYQKYQEKYGDAILQEAFGFADDAEWNRIVNQVAKQLPDAHSQQKFKEAAKEVKTLDGLAQLLNKMFTIYGDSTPFAYMVFDYGGNKQMWIQSTPKGFKAAEALGNICKEESVTLDDVLMNLMLHAASEEGAEVLKGIVSKIDKVEIPGNVHGIPTKEKMTASNEFNTE